MTDQVQELEGREPTPKDLNRQLMQLLSLLPTTESPDEKLAQIASSGNSDMEMIREAEQAMEQVDNDAERRGRSEIKDKLMARLDELLTKSKTTPALRSFLRWGFETGFDHGSGEAREVHGIRMPGVPGFDSVQVDFEDNPESGGIFDPDTAMQIDYRTYGFVQEDQGLPAVWLHYFDENLHGSSPDSTTERSRFMSLLSRAYRTPINDPQSKGKPDFLSSWALQLEQTYGRTPSEYLKGPISH